MSLGGLGAIGRRGGTRARRHDRSGCL